jgi:hypothetical protein
MTKCAKKFHRNNETDFPEQRNPRFAQRVWTMLGADWHFEPISYQLEVISKRFLSGTGESRHPLKLRFPPRLRPASSTSPNVADRKYARLICLAH